MAGRTRLHSDVVLGGETTDDISFRNPKKRILFEDDSCKADVDLTEHMKCYLRIRPFAEGEVSNNEDQNCLSVEDDQTVATHAPKESHTFKNCTHGLGKTTHKFKFSRIFDSTTTQKDFFQETMLDLVKDFIDGQNCLVFTYGVTSSGKTYTIQGKPKDAGILPRALDVLFNSINGKQWPNNILKPKMFMDVARLSEAQSAEEAKIKERTLKMVSFDEPDVMSLLGDDASDMSQVINTTSCSESSNASYATSGRASKDSLDEIFNDLENRVREEAAVSVEDQGLMKFSVWVSFAEIYNEQIFDLLEPIPKKKTIRRPVLRLSDDRNGSPYIRGLKEVHVTSADEAYNLLTVGQKNMRTACTKLNHQSSRSHCIFNIKILRVVDKGIPNHARVSMLSLCDLAGSERYSKTHSKGDRLKEASNINTSLMTLGRCIEILRNNQHHKDKTQLIPFRDSKLTRLFQNFFCGRGKAAMIVNVNQCASMFDETLHVFKFSAVAKQVVVVQKPDPPPKKKLKSAPPPKQVPRPSIPWATPGAADVSLMRSALKCGQGIPLPEDDEDDIEEESDSMDESEVAEFVRIIDNLRQKLKDEKRSKLMMERDIREEVCKEMMEQIVKIENDYEDQLRERDILAEEMMEKRIKIITDSIVTNPRKRPRKDVMEDEDDEWVSSILLHQEKIKVQEREEELKMTKAELETTKKQLHKYITEQENYLSKNTSLQFKLADTEKLKDKNEKEAKKEIKQLKDKLDKLVSKAVNKRKESEVDLGDSCLLETLTQQLQQAKDQIKEQDAEIKELNAMLTEAGETFQQKETEICQLKEVINEDEEKLKQHEIMVRELQTALEDSKKAVDNAEERLVRKDEKIINLESEKQEHQGESVDGIGVQPSVSMCLSANLRNQTNCSSFLEETLRQKNEEIAGWKHKFAREEEESFKREQALINGYKAEINNLKTQIHQLKANLKVSSPLKESASKRMAESPTRKTHSPSMRDREAESPRKKRGVSPMSKQKNVMVDLSENLESSHHFKEDLSRQIKDLQTEFMKNSSVTAELESALQIARLTSEDLESRLEVEETARREAVIKVEQLTYELKGYEELKSKLECEVIEREKSDKEVEKLKLELKELESVQTSFKELQHNYVNLEKKFGKITNLEANLERVEREKEKYLEKFTSMEDTVTHLQRELNETRNINKEMKESNDKLEVNLREHEIELKEKSENLSSKEQLVSELKEKILEKEEENSTITKKLEEVETVNASLREMVNQTTNHIQEKETEIKEIVVENLQNCDSPSSDSLSNLRKKMRDLKQECEKHKNESAQRSNEIKILKEKLEKMNNSKLETENELKKLSENFKDQEFQMEEKIIEMTDVMEGKITLEAKVSELECRNTELESISKEKSSQVMELNDEMNKLKVAREMLEEDVRDLEEEREELQTFVELNSELNKKNENLEKEYKCKENDLKELTLKMNDLQKVHDEQNVNIVNLKYQIAKLESGEINKEESLKQTMALLEKQVETLKKEISEKEASISDVVRQSQEEQTLLETQIQSLRRDLDEAGRSMEEAKGQMENNNALVHELRTNQEFVNNRCKHLENTLKDVEDGEKDRQDLVKNNEGLRQAVMSANAEKNEKETECNIMNVKCHELENLTSELKKQCESSDGEHKILLQQVGDVNNEKLRLKDQIDRLTVKCTEFENVSEKVRTQSDSSCNGHQSLSEAKLQIAELKSSLHMHKTLHDKVKSELIEKEETIARLEKDRNIKSDKSMESSNGKESLRHEFNKLKAQYNDCMKEKGELQCSYENLQLVLDERKIDIEKLQEQLNVKEEKIKVTDLSINEKSVKDAEKLSKACKQQEMLIRKQNLKIKNLENSGSESQVLLKEIEHLDKKCEKLETEKCLERSKADECKVKLEVSEQEIKNLNEAISQQQKIICQQSEKITELLKCDGSHNLTREIDELKSDLQCKTAELKGHQDKLSQVERDLVRINNELMGKEQIIQNLRENLDQFRENECLSPASQSNCARKLRKEKIEIENQLIEARYKIKKLESEVQGGGMLSSPRRVVQVQAGITSPTVHRELDKSQEREQNLRSQLQKASITMKQKNEKISEMEKTLLETSNKLREAEDSLKQRQSLYGVPNQDSGLDGMRKLREEHAERWEIIQNQEKDIKKKETKLQGKSQAITELKQTIKTERDRFETALKDANANEAMIESLKNAISLQEETMEQQDRYIQQKEETINKLQQDVEKYTEKYHQLLTTSGDSGREIREMTRDNARMSAEIEHLKRSVEDGRMNLEKVNDEKLLLESAIKEKTEELNKIESVLKKTTEQKPENNSESKILNSKMIEEMEHLKKTNDDMKRNIQKLTDNKLMLTTVIKENNEELKEMEKLLTEKKTECEEQRMQNNTGKLESLDLKCKEQDTTITDLKNKIREKDHDLRASHKEVKGLKGELSKLKHDLELLRSSTKEKDHSSSEFHKQIHHKNEEIIKLQRSVEDKTKELSDWKLERDKLVHGLEGLMKKQQREIGDLKKQKTELEERLSQQTTSRSRHRSTTQYDKVIHVPDSTDDVQEVFKSPLMKSTSRRGCKRKSQTLERTDSHMPSSTKKETTDDNITFVSEDGDVSSHIEIDATPAIAAKTLRKNRKKRSSVDLLRALTTGRHKAEKTDKENKKSTRGRKPKNDKVDEIAESSGRGISRMGSILSAIKESPITRSAKKFLGDITDVSAPNKDSDSMVEIEDHGTQMSPVVEISSKRGNSRRKHTLYKDNVQISEPLDCVNFVGTNDGDVHDTVQRKLRGRRK